MFPTKVIFSRVFIATTKTAIVRSSEQSAEEGWVWAPWRFEKLGEFVDVYTGEQIRSDLWVTNQPNGGPGQQCSGWWKGNGEVMGLG